MNRPFISIITVCKNSESTIERTIKSVIDQDYDSYEYIIIDGKSEDGTLGIIERYKDSISVMVSETDGGISDAFNKGIQLAKGDVIGIINSDDGLMPGALKSIAANYDEESDVYRGITVLWEEESNTRVEEMPSMYIKLYGRNHICHQSTFVKKDAYKRVGMFNTNYKYSMDYDMLLRLQRAGLKFKFVNKSLAFYTLGGKSSEKFTPERRREIETIILSNGGKMTDVIRYRAYRWTANIIKKFIPKRITMRVK